jgi:hypothetical protein
MDWNKKNLLKVGDYFHYKLKNLISEARSSLNEEEKRSLSGILDQISPSGLLHIVRFYPQFSTWGNFLKENNCEQYDKNDFWVIFSKMATRQLDGVIVPLYKDRERESFDADMPWTEPDSLILCPKDFAEKILALESFGGE